MVEMKIINCIFSGWVTANLLITRNDDTSILATSSMVKVNKHV